jgi:hypothetical protein
MIDIAANCRALLLCRMYLQRNKDGTVTAAWMRYWNLTGRQENPPHATKVPGKLTYLQCYAIDMAYIQHADHYETPARMRNRICTTLRTMALTVNGELGMRIMNRYPGTEWDTVWENLEDVWTSIKMQSAWYQVVHDIIPTQERLIRISSSNTDKCPICGRTDNILHRLNECKGSAEIWDWTRTRIALMLRTAPRHIPPEWTIRPDFHIWPPQRRGAIL